jgi:hypothetical protein
MFKLLGIDEAPEPTFVANNKPWPTRQNRKQRRALQSVARRMARAYPRAIRVLRRAFALLRS